MNVKPSLGEKAREELKNFSCKVSRILEDFYIEATGCKSGNIMQQSTDKIKIDIKTLAEKGLVKPLVEFVINEYNMYSFEKEFPQSKNMNEFNHLFEKTLSELQANLIDYLNDPDDQAYFTREFWEFRDSIRDYIKQELENKNEY